MYKEIVTWCPILLKFLRTDLKTKKLDCALSDDAASTGSAWPFGSKSGYLPYWAVLTSVFSHYGLDNKNFPPINQNLIPRSAITEFLTSQNAKRRVEIKKKRTKTRQASLECHRCQRIDFFPVSEENGGRTTA